MLKDRMKLCCARAQQSQRWRSNGGHKADWGGINIKVVIFFISQAAARIHVENNFPFVYSVKQVLTFSLLLSRRFREFKISRRARAIRNLNF